MRILPPLLLCFFMVAKISEIICQYLIQNLLKNEDYDERELISGTCHKIG